MVRKLCLVFFFSLFPSAFFLFAGTGVSPLLDSLLREIRQFSFTDSAGLFSVGSKAIEISKIEKFPMGEAEVYFAYGNFYYVQADYKRAEDYYSIALDIARKNNGDSIRGIIEIRRSFIEFELGNWEKAESMFEEVLSEAEKASDTITIIGALNGLAQVKEKQSRRDETMKHYIRALSLAEKSNRKNEMAYVLNNLGLLKLNTGQMEEAKRDLLLATQMASEAGNDRIVANANLNIGLIYDETGQKDSALYFYKTFLASEKKTGEPRSIATGYVNLTSAYYDRRDYVTAMNYCDSALKLIAEKNLVEIKAKGFINKAQVLRKQGDPAKAISYLDSALSAAREINSFEDMAFCYSFQAEIKAEQNKFEEALTLYQLYKSYNDSTNNLSAKKKMAELQVQYDVQQKETELLKERNKVDLLKKETEIRQARQYQIMFLIFGISVAILLFFYIRYIRLSKKQQESFSRNLIENIEKERNRIAKDLHDDIGASLSMIKNKIFAAREKPVFFDEINKDVSTVIEHTRSISHQLYPSYIEKTGLKSVIGEFTSKAERDSGIMFLTEIGDIGNNLLPEQKAHIFRIVQECVNNTLKYAKATAAKLMVSEYKNGIRMIYQDNGVGISSKTSSDGIGMMSIRERTKILHGEFTQGSNDGKGVKFTFMFYPQNSK